MIDRNVELGKPRFRLLHKGFRIRDGGACSYFALQAQQKMRET